MSLAEVAHGQATQLARGRSKAERLADAQRLLAQASDAWAGRAATASVPEASLLAVAEPLRPLFRGGGLQRGTTVALPQSGALLLALLAEASAAETWCAVVGMPELGMVAAEEAGLDLSRTALVPRPGADLVAVTAALVDGVDLVAVAGTPRLRAGDRQRLAARARQRGAVLLAVGGWSGADVALSLRGSSWHGIPAPGAGRLRCRQVRVRADGRGAAGRGREVSVLLPGPTGAIAAAHQPGQGRLTSGTAARPLARRSA